MKKRLKCITSFCNSNHTSCPKFWSEKKWTKTFNGEYEKQHPRLSRTSITQNPWVPRVVCSIMYVFNSTCIYNFFTRNWRAFGSSNNKTKFGHCTMILSTSIKTHSCILYRQKELLRMSLMEHTYDQYTLNVLIMNSGIWQRSKEYNTFTITQQ